MNSFKEKFKIAKILASLFTHSSTPEEEKNYRAWLDENPEHQKIADRILNKETYEENSRLIKSFSSQKAWDRIYPLLGGEKTSGFLSWKRSLKYAALLLLLLIPISYLIYNWVAGEPIGEITPGTHGGELTLSNGNTFNLFENVLPEGATEVFIIDSKGINYQTPANKPKVKEIKNTLRTLHGMECHIVLSDGTKVHLNAESQLTYPICFSDKERIVQVEGEAYFDVVADEEHPFVVQTHLGEITVLGTEFNVNAYADAPVCYTTLVRGKVNFSTPNAETIALSPGEQAVVFANSSTKRVVNLEEYVGWVNGMYIFNDRPLGDIMKTFERWYDIQVYYETPHLRDITYSGSLKRYGTINSFLDALELTGDLTYKISGRNILIYDKVEELE